MEDVGVIIDSVANEIAPGDEEFRLVAHAIALAESGGNPNSKNISNIEESYGLYQNNRRGGRGTGHSVENLLDPTYNARLSLTDLYRYYVQGREKGLKGQDLVAYVSRNGQRPAKGAEFSAAKRYGQLVSGARSANSTAPVVKSTPTPIPGPKDYTQIFRNYQPSFMQNMYQGAVDMVPNWVNNLKNKLISPIQAGYMQGATNTYTVRPGDTLWGIAQRYLGSGDLWKQLQGYSGDPRKLPIGTKINIPTQQKQQPLTKEQAIAQNYKPPSVTQIAPIQQYKPTMVEAWLSGGPSIDEQLKQAARNISGGGGGGSW